MAYVRHGTGPNDHKKGNRTRGADRAYHGGNKGNSSPAAKAAITAASKKRAADRAKYKEIAENAAKGLRYGQEYAAILHDNLSAYIIEQRQQKRPLTIAGLIRASGMGSDTYYRYRAEEADYLLYKYIEEHNIDSSLEGSEIVTDDGEKILLWRLSAIIKNAELAVQEQLEENCYTNKGNPAGSIFGLKARYEWQDQPAEVKQTNQLTVNVATLEEAKDAIKRLKG